MLSRSNRSRELTRVPECLEAFAATKLSKILPSRPPGYDVKIPRRFRSRLCFHLQDAADGEFLRLDAAVCPRIY